MVVPQRKSPVVFAVSSVLAAAVLNANEPLE